MPIIIPSKSNRRRIFIRGAKNGSGIIDSATSAMIESGLPWEKIFAGIGGAAWAGLASYAVKKGIEGMISDKRDEVPPLSSAPVPQGTFKHDILPVKNDITIVNPENHYIDLPNGMKKTTGDIVIERPRKKYGGKIKKSNQVDKILNDKSKQILMNMKSGRGIYKI